MFSPSGILVRAGLALLCVAAVWVLDTAQRPAALRGAAAAPALLLATGPGAGAGHWVPLGGGTIPMPEGVPAAHASALLPMPAGDPAVLTAFWFAGDRESAPNVQIVAAQFDRARQAWSPARVVVNRHAMGVPLGMGLRRLGNPVAWMDAESRMHLFVVATGWGGWAASRVLHLQQVAGSPASELKFEPLRVLPLSWLWNLSYLVRTAPLPLADGGMVLPAYFELGAKTPVALRFDGGGGLVGLARISQRSHLLQPTLVATTPTHWTALMRDTRPQGKIGVSQTHDGGKTWTDAPDLPLDNPDAGISSLSVGDQHLLVFNPSVSDRKSLRMARSADGLQWSTALELELGSPGQEFSYPAMAWADQSLWLSYTDQRKSIAWRRLQWVNGGASDADNREAP
ncbi:MAG: exo-alpha-sialidase [Rhodoferax sp.]|nr:exo-alpha-sialidase [Rhodoferax sp.]